MVCFLFCRFLVCLNLLSSCNVCVCVFFNVSLKDHNDLHFFIDVGIESTFPLRWISTSIVTPFFALDFGETLYASLHIFFLSFCFVQELVVVYIFLCNFVHLHPCFFIQFVWRRTTMLFENSSLFFFSCQHCFLFLSCYLPYVKLLLFFNDSQWQTNFQKTLNYIMLMKFFWKVYVTWSLLSWVSYWMFQLV